MLFTFYRSGVKTTADVVSLAVVACEAMFAVFCWVQCIANFHNRDMSGGTDACYFQAIYATLYLFVSVMLVGLAAMVSLFGMPLISAAVASLSVWAVGMFLAVLPYMGAGQYRFPKDFCMCDLQHPTYAVLWLTVWIIVAILLIVAVLLPNSRRIARVGSTQLPGCIVGIAQLIGYFAFFTTPTLIDLIYIAGGSQPGTIYGALAIILHTQQVANPLLYGLLWRQYMNSDEEVAITDTATAAKDDVSPSELSAIKHPLK